MRCSVCDYCEGEAQSSYYSSVTEYKGQRSRRVYVDKKTNREVCTYCVAPPEKDKPFG